MSASVNMGKLLSYLLVEHIDVASATAAGSVTSSAPAAAAAASHRPLITDNMLSDAMRRVRPTSTSTSTAAAARQPCSAASSATPSGEDGSRPERSSPSAGGSRAKPLRPVTVAPSTDWLERFVQRQTREDVTDADK